MRPIDAAQSRLVDGLQTGVKSLIDRYFAEAREIVRAAILHATHDTYNEATARGQERAAVMFRAYLDVLDIKYADRTGTRDPRAEIERPPVTAEELRLALVAQGAQLRTAEVITLAQSLKIQLAP